MIHGTEAVHPEVSSTGRLGYEYYNKLGYVPCDVKIHENAARTLEYPTQQRENGTPEWAYSQPRIAVTGLV